MTDAEQVLWQRVRRQQILGLEFYRQKPILNFIMDFIVLFYIFEILFFDFLKFIIIF